MRVVVILRFEIVSREKLKVMKTETLAEQKCAHCGDAAGATPIRDGEHVFCCAGCKTVHDVLKANDLCKYYRIAPGQPRPKPVSEDYAFLDDLAERIVEFSSTQESRATFRLPDMHCSSCLWLLEQLPRLERAIVAATVHFAHKTVSVRFNHEKIKLSQIAGLLAGLGYRPDLSYWHEPEKRAAPPRRLWYQIGAAGFAFGNIMLLNIPDYLAAGEIEPEMRRLFAGAGLALTGLTFYAAKDYFLRAFAGLVRRKLPIDVPLALGMTAMFVLSVYEIFAQTGPGYLDSLAGLTFFLLVGRWAQEKTYHYLSFERDYRAYFPLAVRRRRDGREAVEAIEKLQPGDELSVRMGEVVPVDGVLLSPAAMMDYTFLTGESKPVPVRRGETVYAGGRPVAGACDLQVKRTVARSRLTSLWNSAAFEKKPVGESVVVARIVPYFTAAVLTVAALAAGFWAWNGQIGRAAYAFASVLIIACPCALAWAVPFTYGHATRYLGYAGLYLKNPLVVERMAAVERVVFDKTGTLTVAGAEKAVLTDAPRPLNAAEGAAVAAVAARSLHPMSRALAAALATDTAAIAVDGVVEHPGRGIEGRAAGMRVRIGSAAFVPGGKGRVNIEIDGEYRAAYDVPTSFRPGMREMLARLSDFRPAVYSGDSHRAEKSLREILPPDAEVRMNMSPSDKTAALMAATYRTMMVGDGLNDAGALQAAFVGVAVTEGHARFTPASDAILDGPALVHLPDFLRFARQARRTVYACFGVSTFYNLVGLTFAVRGELSPLIAAVLMPFISIGIIAMATGLTAWKARRAAWKVHRAW
jgi:Cu+-exporting ATPase